MVWRRGREGGRGEGGALRVDGFGPYTGSERGRDGWKARTDGGDWRVLSTPAPAGVAVAPRELG
jgi:hypothetical protein